MKNSIVRLLLFTLLTLVTSVSYAQSASKAPAKSSKAPAQASAPAKAPATATAPAPAVADSAFSANNPAEDDLDSAAAEKLLDQSAAADTAAEAEPVETTGFHKTLKTEFIEGNAGFMSLVALALILGLAFCIERIIYLSLSEINAKKFMQEVDAKIQQRDIEGAKALCRDTRGPVASICYQGLMRIDEGVESVERSIVSYGSVQSANLEKGCSWITLFIAMAPSLGFLGTVIGMVMAFNQIQLAGDISPTIVAAGMKVALITTIFGIIVALILQVFYNYILSKIDHLTAQMEESAITLLDAVMKLKLSK